MWQCIVHFCYEMYAEVSLPELLEEPHQPIFNFPKGSLARRNLCIVASRASGLAAKWCWLIHNDEAQMQFSVLSVFCYGGISMYLWLAIAIAVAYVRTNLLLWKYS